ncbi:MAG: porin [Acidobacteria bacterium]|nr:porin [Acidobacteriota bacterium]
MTLRLKMFFAAVVLAIFSQSTFAQQPLIAINSDLIDKVSDKVSDNKTSDTSDKASANKPAEAKGENKPNNETELMLREVQDLQRTVKLLETRIKELESKLEKSAESNSSENTSKEVATTNTTNTTNVNNAVNNTVASTVSPEPLKPQDGDSAKDKVLSFFERTEVSGFVDAYYGYNFNRPDVSNNVTVFDNQLRNFDTKHNQFSLNMAKLVLNNAPGEDHRLGFRLDLSFGPAAEIIHASEPGGADVFRNLQQAYLSYLAPVGKGLQIDFGKYVTYHGNEVIETKDNWNYSRSILFAFGIPYYHYGVRLTYPVSDKFTLGFAMHNGYNNVVDNNARKSFSLQAIIKPTSKITFVQNYTGGPEQANNKDDNRHLFDGTLIYTITDKVSFASNYFYVFDRINGARVHAKGIVGYLRLQPRESFAFTPRFEVYDDNDGFTTGTVQTVKSLTLTGERTIKGGLIGRLEYRRDFSNKNFFNKSIGRTVEAQTTLTLGVVYSFSSK